MKLYLSILFFLIPITFCCAFQDLDINYTVRNYNDENGLPINGVKDIISDSLGFVWLATEGGLARFDGQKFKVYTKSQIGLRSDRIIHFNNNTPNGNLYAVAEFGQTIRIRNGAAANDTLSRILYMDMVNLAPIKRAGFQIPSQEEIFSRGFKYYKIISASRGRYYVYFNQQITLVDAGKVQFNIPFKGEMSIELPQLQWSHQRTKDLVGNQYNINNFYTIGGQLFYHNNDLGCSFLAISPKNDGVRQLVSLQGEITKNPAYSFNKDNVRILCNSVNKQCFAYLNSHLYLITWHGGAFTTRLLLKGLDFDQNYIRSAYYKESDGCIYLGSQAKGLFVLTPKSFGTMMVPGQESDNIFYAQAPYGASSIITPQGFVLEPNKDAIEILEIPDDNLTSKYTSLRDHNQNWWISREQSIYKYSADGRHIVKRYQLAKQPLRLYEDLDGGIWSGSGNGTITYLRDQFDKPVAFEKILTIPQTEITWFLQVRPGKLWIGTTNGLYELDIQSNQITRTKGLEELNIRCLYNTSPNQLWITTYGSGIFLLENGKLIKLPTDSNQYLNYAHCIVEDGAGSFWITTNKGLFQAQKKDLLDFAHQYLKDVFYLHYDKMHGFKTNEFNGGCQPCGIKIGTGVISVPSLDGFVWFDPTSIKNPALGHPFVLEDFNVNGRHTPSRDSITLPYNFSLFTLSVTTPYFGVGSNIHFKYNLRASQDQEGKWFSPDKNHKISIFNLPPGNYILTVKKMTGFGNQGIERRIFMTVSTPWFLHWAFLLLAMSTLVGIVVGIVRWRTGYLLKQNQILGQKVADRTKELSAALDGLQKSELDLSRQLQVQSVINGAISHDIRSPLKYLSSNIQKIRQQIESEFPAFPYIHIAKLIHQSTDQVLDMTEDLLRFIKIIKDHKEIAMGPISVRQILEAKSKLFTEIAKENQTTIEVVAQDDIIVNSNRQMLEIIIHNLLDNAVKSTFQDSITLTAENVGGKVSISVADTGGGMPQDIADWFNFISKSDSGVTLAGSGFGLVVVKEIAVMLGINIKVHTTETGTKVELLLNRGLFE